MGNPLLSLHRQGDAEFQDYGGIEIVQTFGNPPAEYAAIRKSAAMMDLPQRSVLELSGEDRLSFLNGLLSNQTWDKQRKAGLAAGSGVYSFLLNQKGRILADMNVLEMGDRALLDMDARMVEAVKKDLEKYLFREKVKIEDTAQRRHEMMLLGPQSKQVIEKALGGSLGEPRQLGVVRARLLGQDVIIYRDDMCGVPGYILIAPMEAAVSSMRRLSASSEERLSRASARQSRAAFFMTLKYLQVARFRLRRKLFYYSASWSSDHAT